MKLTISFKHFKHTPALDERIQEKSQKLEKYFQGSTNIQWVCWVHGDEHWAEIKVHGPKFDFVAKAYADNMYKSLDLCVDKMERQIEKQKDMKRNKLHNNSQKSPKYHNIDKMIWEEEKLQEKEIQDKSA